MSLESSQARQLAERAEAIECILQVGLSEWYNPAWRAAVRRAGTVRSIEVERLHPRSGRGLDLDVVQDFMIHDLDWISRWLGEPVERLVARGRKCVNARWDEAEAELWFESGVRACLRTSRVADQRARTLRVEGTAAVIETDLISGAIEGVGPAESAHVEVRAEDEPLDRQLADFVLACRTRIAPESDGAVGVAALELVERVQQAIEAETMTRRPVGGDGS